MSNPPQTPTPGPGSSHPLAAKGPWCRIHHFDAHHDSRDCHKLRQKLRDRGEVYTPKHPAEIRLAGLQPMASTCGYTFRPQSARKPDERPTALSQFRHIAESGKPVPEALLAKPEGATAAFAFGGVPGSWGWIGGDMEYPELGAKKRKLEQMNGLAPVAGPNRDGTWSPKPHCTIVKGQSPWNDPPSTRSNLHPDPRFYNDRPTLPVATLATLTYHPRTTTSALQMDCRTNPELPVDFEIIREPTEGISFRFDIFPDDVTHIHMCGGHIKIRGPTSKATSALTATGVHRSMSSPPPLNPPRFHQTGSRGPESEDGELRGFLRWAKDRVQDCSTEGDGHPQISALERLGLAARHTPITLASLGQQQPERWVRMGIEAQTGRKVELAAKRYAKLRALGVLG